MPSAAASTYIIQEPFTIALRRVREAIGEEHLRIPTELDISGRLKREFGIVLPPCRVLSVDCPIALLRGVALDSSIAVWLPLHVVVSAHGDLTSVQIARPAPDLVEDPVRSVQDRITRALQRIAMRESPIGVAVPDQPR